MLKDIILYFLYFLRIVHVCLKFTLVTFKLELVSAVRNFTTRSLSASSRSPRVYPSGNTWLVVFVFLVTQIITFILPGTSAFAVGAVSLDTLHNLPSHLLPIIVMFLRYVARVFHAFCIFLFPFIFALFFVY